MGNQITKRLGLHLFFRSFLAGVFILSFGLTHPVQAAPLNADPIIVMSASCDLLGNALFTITNTGGSMTVPYTWNLYQGGGFLTAGPFTLTGSPSPGSSTQLGINGLYGSLTVIITDNLGAQVTSATAFCENHPAVTINQAAGQTDPASSSPINFTARFATTVSGFGPDDVSISGMSAVPGISVTDSGDHKTYNIAVTGMKRGETIIATIPAGAALSVGVPGAGYGNRASTSTDNRIYYEGPPVISITGSCDNVGNALFTITNTGGSMTVPYTWSLYQGGGFLTAGLFTLTAAPNPGSSTQLGINGLYGSLTIAIADNLGAQVTSAAAFCPDYRTHVTINQAATQPDPTNLSPILFDVVFDSAVTGFTSADVRISGMAGTPGITVTDSGDHVHYRVAVTGMTNGETISATIPQNAVTESHGAYNFASTSTDNSITYETTRPSVTLNQAPGQSDPASSLPILFEVIFSERINPATFTIGDLLVSGSASYSAVITDSGDHIHFTIAVSGVQSGSLISLQIPANTVSDQAGNLNFASTSTDNSVPYNDTTAPSVTVEQAINQPDPTSQSPIHFTVTFNEPINLSTFTASDVLLSGTTGANLAQISETTPNDGTTFDLFVSGMSSNGNLTASIPQGRVNDLAGNPNNTSTAVDNTVAFDTALPSVTVEQAVSQSDPTNSSPIVFLVVFSQPIVISTFTPSDITLGGTANPTTAVISESAPNDGTTFSISVSGMATDGSVTASIAANAVQTVDGNSNNASTSTDNSVIFDTAKPAVNIEQSPTQPDPTAGSPIEYIVTFNEPIDRSSLTSSDITLGGSAASTTAVITEIAPNDGTTFRIQVSGMTSSGLVTASIGPGKIADISGNLNTSSISLDNTVTYDVVLPGVTVEQALGQPDPTNAAPINFTVTFSKPIVPSSFTPDDITLIGSTGADTVLITEIAPNNGTKFNLQVSGMTNNGIVIASISESKVQDSLGNLNTASTSTDNSITYDTTGPSVTVEQAASQRDPSNQSPFHFTVIFNEPIDPATFTATDITVQGTAGATTAIITESAPNDGTTFDVQISGMTADGSVIISILENMVQDFSGSGNSASTSVDHSVTYDKTAPAVQIEQSVNQPDPTNTAPIHFTVTFNEPIDLSTFTSDDIALGGTGVPTTVFIKEIVPNNGTTFDIAISGMAGSGMVTAAISANGILDLSGNLNPSSTSADNAVSFDLVVPEVASTSLLANYEASGPAIFTITFNKEVFDPAGDSDIKDVTNPENYLIMDKGPNKTIDTQSCIGGVQNDDKKVAVTNVTYIKPTATVNLVSPLPPGDYRLFICGTTSIVDLSGNHLGGGLDFTFDFTVSQPIASLPKTGFAPEQNTLLLPQTVAYTGLGNVWLEIPSLGVKSSIVGVPKTNGDWDVTWLGRNTGYLAGTAYPTWPGNTVLTAHVWDANNMPGVFIGLKDLHYGDRFYIHMGDKVYVYEVRQNKLISPKNISAALVHEELDWVTLLTCESYSEKDGTYQYRRMVRAVLVEVR